MSEASAPSETPPVAEPSIPAERPSGIEPKTAEVPGPVDQPGNSQDEVEVDLDAIERDLEGIERSLDRLANGTYWDATDDAPASSTDHR